MDSIFLRFPKVHGDKTHIRCFLTQTRQKSTKEELEDEPEISVTAVLSDPVVTQGRLMSSLPFRHQR